MIILLFHLYKYVHRLKKKKKKTATNDNKKLPKINREKLTITLKILLVIFNVFYFTDKFSSCIALYIYFFNLLLFFVGSKDILVALNC